MSSPAISGSGIPVRKRLGRQEKRAEDQKLRELSDAIGRADAKLSPPRGPRHPLQALYWDLHETPRAVTPEVIDEALGVLAVAHRFISTFEEVGVRKRRLGALAELKDSLDTVSRRAQRRKSELDAEA